MSDLSPSCLVGFDDFSSYKDIDGLMMILVESNMSLCHFFHPICFTVPSPVAAILISIEGLFS